MGKDCGCKKEKDCGCKKEKEGEASDSLVVQNANAKNANANEYEDNTPYRKLDSLPLHFVTEILSDKFIIDLSNHFKSKGIDIQSKMNLNRIDGTRYPKHKFEGSLMESDINSIPFSFNLDDSFSYVITNLEIMYEKDGQLMPLSKDVAKYVKLFVCSKVRSKLLKKQIYYLETKKTESSEYNTTLEEILDKDIGTIIDDLTALLDPINPTLGYVKKLTNLYIKKHIPVHPVKDPLWAANGIGNADPQITYNCGNGCEPCNGNECNC